MKTYRVESDSMGEVKLPDDAYWGAQTERAVRNFGISPLRIPVPMLRAMSLVKSASAEANRKLGLLEDKLAEAILKAAGEVIDGKFDDQFPIDVFQTGSGTSWNMNMNEVLSNRANELLGSPKGAKNPVHPNDHVNRGQSSNDVIPTAINIACRLEAEKLRQAIRKLRDGLEARSRGFSGVLKLGRTHLQDAVPMTLGQEFSGYAEQIAKAEERLRNTFAHLEELPLGGTAIGTGLNTHAGFKDIAVSYIASWTGLPFKPAANPFEGIAARDAQAELMGALNVLAVSLMKIANDLRLLASGPRSALGEIVLPALQPGSSIMPGKVNPVIPEMVIQAAAHVMGKHLAVTVACQNGPLELNIMQPLIAYETVFALNLMERTCTVFLEKCVSGITADEKRCREWIERSLALVTPLALKVGYERAARIAYAAYRDGITVREAAIRDGAVTAEEADTALDPARMTGPEGAGR